MYLRGSNSQQKFPLVAKQKAKPHHQKPDFAVIIEAEDSLQSVHPAIKRPAQKIPTNSVVVELDSMSSKVTNVSLHCGEAFKDLEVYWEKKNLRRGTGVQLNIKVEDFLHGGNYTCHRKDNKEVLNYTMVLIHKTRDSQGDYPKTILQKLSEKNYIKCESNSHCGKFECSWNFDVNSRGVEIVASAHRSSGSSMDGSIQCTIGTKEKNKALCEELRFCPYREESDQVTFVMHIIHGTQLEEYVEKFFLSDIVFTKVFTLKLEGSVTKFYQEKAHPVDLQFRHRYPIWY
ncbi:IL12B protein, partial [Polypterus senegalus]